LIFSPTSFGMRPFTWTLRHRHEKLNWTELVGSGGDWGAAVCRWVSGEACGVASPDAAAPEGPALAMMPREGWRVGCARSGELLYGRRCVGRLERSENGMRDKRDIKERRGQETPAGTVRTRKPGTESNVLRPRGEHGIE
jgi:hypothetical protein